LDCEAGKESLVVDDRSERRVVRVALAGELDVADRDELRELLRPAEDADEAIIDLRDVRYLDSTALGCLIHLKKRLLERGAGPVILISPQPTVRRLLQISQLESLFEIREESG
jgi:anti-anti-sigma factor